MTKDETVDGPRIAAKILNSMPPERKRKLLESIKNQSPEAFQKIENNILSFEDIVNINERGLQLLIKTIEHSDLILSLKTAKPEIKDTLLNNMSERKKKIVLEDLEALPPTPVSEVEQAQKRIIQKIDTLRASGLIQTETPDDVWV
jgi:flagellar motor switch protein FliG